MLQWTWECQSLWDSVFISLGYIPRNGISGHMVVLLLISWGDSYCFAQWLYQLTFSLTVYKWFFFLHIFTAFISLSLFLMLVIPVGVRWYSSWLLWFVFPWWPVMSSIFSCTYWSFEIFFGKVSQYPCFNWILYTTDFV